MRKDFLKNSKYQKNLYLIIHYSSKNETFGQGEIKNVIVKKL